MNDVTIPDPNTTPAAFGSLCKNLLTRARECKLVDPAICYWGCYRVVEVAMGAPRTPEGTHWIMSILDSIEQMKPVLASNEAVTSTDVGAAHVENFALKIFDSADEAERAGQYSIGLAKRFTVAAQFMEILRTFDSGNLPDETDQKRKYALWKAKEVAKAVKAGRLPGSAIADDEAPSPPAKESSNRRESSTQQRSSPPVPDASSSARRTSSSAQQRPILGPSSSSELRGAQSTRRDSGSHQSRPSIDHVSHGSRRTSNSGPRPPPIMTITSPTDSTVTSATSPPKRPAMSRAPPSDSWSIAATHGGVDREHWSTAATPGERDVAPWKDEPTEPKRKDSSESNSSGRPSTAKRGSGDSGDSGGSGSTARTAGSGGRANRPDHIDLPKKSVMFMGPDGAPLTPDGAISPVSEVAEIGAPPPSVIDPSESRSLTPVTPASTRTSFPPAPTPPPSHASAPSRAPPPPASTASQWSTKVQVGTSKNHATPTPPHSSRTAHTAPAPAPVPSRAPPAPVPVQPSISAKLPRKEVDQVQKWAKWAISALDYDDYAEARKNLQRALDALPPS